MRRLRLRLGLKGFDGVNSEGLSGGLALFWHESWFVDIKAMNKNYIDAYVRVSQNAPLWRLTCVYGEPRVENRHSFWEALQNLCMESDLPWLIFGDFNECLWPEEHFSGTPRPVRQMEDFRDALNICHLHDLGFSGTPYTYDNKRKGSANVRVRLDRAVATHSWRDLFCDTTVQHLVSPCSDHQPILINLMQEQRRCNQAPRRQYEVFWERSMELPEKIAAAWESTGQKNDLGSVHQGLDRVMTELQQWSKRSLVTSFVN
jgi:hypothetical protein